MQHHCMTHASPLSTTPMQFWASEGEDVENQDELDAVLEWMKTTQGDKDPLASPAAAAFMRQGLLTGMLGIE
jgi:hypothetical protein